MRAWMFYNTNVYFVSQSDFRQTVNLKCVENKYKILIINTFGTLILNAFHWNSSHVILKDDVFW